MQLGRVERLQIEELDPGLHEDVDELLPCLVAGAVLQPRGERPPDLLQREAGQTLVEGVCTGCVENCLVCDSDLGTCDGCNVTYFVDENGQCSPCEENCDYCVDANTCANCSTGWAMRIARA